MVKTACVALTKRTTVKHTSSKAQAMPFWNCCIESTDEKQIKELVTLWLLQQHIFTYSLA